jgi:antibiotic biosynthesis monooxygenase (ABM) superfamily enzyme
VRRKRLEKWKLWVQDLIATARQTSGYAGSFIVKDGEQYVIVSRFDNYALWKQWVESPARAAMMQRLENEQLIRRPPEIDYPAGGIFQFSSIPGAPLSSSRKKCGLTAGCE